MIFWGEAVGVSPLSPNSQMRCSPRGSHSHIIGFIHATHPSPPEAEGVGVGRTKLAGEHTRVGTRRHDSNSNARAAVSLRAPT